VLLLSIGKGQERGVLLQGNKEIYAYCGFRETTAGMACLLVRNMRYFVNVINIDIIQPNKNISEEML
jgi:hypothetical protein